MYAHGRVYLDASANKNNNSFLSLSLYILSDAFRFVGILSMLGVHVVQ